MASEENQQRVSVSRDTLRAELAEMELRLRTYFAEVLALKADSIVVNKLQNDFTLLQKTALLQEGPIARQVASHEQSLRRLEDGEFTKSIELAVGGMIASQLAKKDSVGWTARERKIAITGLLLTGISVVTTIFFLLATLGVFG